MSAPRTRNRPLPPMWRVTLARHTGERRIVPGRTARLPAVDAEDACLTVIRWTHGEVGVPPMKRCVRHSLQFATATRTGTPPRTKVVEAYQQLLLDERRAA